MTTPSVAFQGIPGSFSHLATLSFFKANEKASEIRCLGQSRFKDIFACLASANASHAVVPVENSLVGSIYEIYDLLSDYNVQIVGEHYEHIVHNLLCRQASPSFAPSLAKIKKVFSHPKALEQCQNFFDENPNIEKVVFSDTAGAAKYVAECNEESVAAIASTEAARLYGLHVLRQHLEDDKHNITRFLVLANSGVENLLANKCSLIFTLPHVPQSLFRALQAISVDGVNVTKIESRPIQGKPFEYVFYIDFEFPLGAIDFAKKRIDDFRSRVNLLHVLGFYPAAQTNNSIS